MLCGMGVVGVALELWLLSSGQQEADMSKFSRISGFIRRERERAQVTGVVHQYFRTKNRRDRQTRRRTSSSKFELLFEDRLSTLYTLAVITGALSASAQAHRRAVFQLLDRTSISYYIQYWSTV